METLHINKDLLDSVKALNKHRSKTGRKDLSELVYCDDYGAITITDGVKLLYCISKQDNSLPLNNIVNYIFYSKYYKKCKVVMDDNKYIKAMLDTELVDIVDLRGYSYPNLKSLKFNFDIELNFNLWSRKYINKKIDLINKFIKQYNDRCKLLRKECYNIDDTQIIFSTNKDNLMDAYIRFTTADDDFKKSLTPEIRDACLLVNQHPIFYDIEWKVGFNYLQFVDCINAINKIDSNNSIKFMFESTKPITSPIKIDTEEGSYTLLMPIRINN